jgi:hypothetical protein
MSRREAHTALDPSTDRRPGIRDGPPQLARDDRYVAIWASRTNGAFWPAAAARRVLAIPGSGRSRPSLVQALKVYGQPAAR